MEMELQSHLSPTLDPPKVRARDARMEEHASVHQENLMRRGRAALERARRDNYNLPPRRWVSRKSRPRPPELSG